MTGRHLHQNDVVLHEIRIMPDGTHAQCRSASDTHVRYQFVDGLFNDCDVIRRDIWCSWPVIDEEAS